MEDSTFTLMTRAVDFIVQEQWLIWINVTFSVTTSSESEPRRHPSSWFLIHPNATVEDVKKVILRSHGHLPADQRLSLAETGAHVFQGLLLPKGANGRPSSTSLRLNLQVVPLNPCLESLYEMVYMGDTEDRDGMMEQLTKRRPARGCACSDAPLAEIDDWSTSLGCCLCEERFASFHCKKCNFCLCRRCREEDSGRLPAEDPYEAVTAIAKQLGSQLVRMAILFGGNSHFGGSISLVWRPEWGDVKPPTNGSWGEGAIRSDRQVLHKGVRLVVRLSEGLFSIRNREASEAGGKPWRRQVLDSVYLSGATVEELTNVGGKARQHTVSYGHSRVEPVMALVSFEVDEVHLELVNLY